jgi:hypothetical protein
VHDKGDSIVKELNIRQGKYVAGRAEEDGEGDNVEAEVTSCVVRSVQKCGFA